MIFFTALVFSANLYFIKPNYYAHRVTVDITVVSQSWYDYSIKPANLEIAVRRDSVTIGHIRKALMKTITHKRARDRLIRKVQRQLDVRIIG
jgi:hypothetical protein